MSLLRRSDAARRRVRRYLVARDGLTCQRCGQPIRDRPSIGHRVALAYGGSDHADNLGLEHLDCNLGLTMPGFFISGSRSPAVPAAQNGPKIRSRVRYGPMPPDA
jgi:hypothetical protein